MTTIDQAPLSASVPRFRNISVHDSLHCEIEARQDGSTLIQVSEALEAFPETMNERFEHWLQLKPDAVLVAQRDDQGLWQTITYSEMMTRMLALGQALVERQLSAERPLMILSDNDLEHLSLGLAANWVGVPYCSVSPAYSLISSDYAKLKHIIATLTPGLVFASGPAYAKAIAAAVPEELEVVIGAKTFAPNSKHQCTLFSSLLSTQPTEALQAASKAVGSQTITKFMFTSGSTKLPKGVPITHRMWCANQQMILQVMAFMKSEPPVLVDWLP